MASGSIWKNQNILVTGGKGFLGSHLVAALKRRGATDIAIPEYPKVDLTKLEDCRRVVKGQEIIIHLAAKVGGIGFNQAKPGELFYDNAIMGLQLMEAARQAGVKKFVAIGTICAFPKFTPVPFKEDDLWNGYPEETNAPYGLAKKMLLVQAQAYRQQYGFNAIYLLPVNLYGPGDNFDPHSSHVIPALIRKVFEAKKNGRDSIEVWGTGQPTREFIYVEDAAEGIALATERYNDPDPVNLGSGIEISIKDLAVLIIKLSNANLKIRWNATKPDGQPRRRLDTSRARERFGFQAKTSFEDGLKKTIDWFEKHSNPIESWTNSDRPTSWQGKHPRIHQDLRSCHGAKVCR